MRNIRTHNRRESNWIYLPILSILSSVLLFMVWYGIVVPEEQAFYNYCVIAFLSLALGVLLTIVLSSSRKVDEGNKIYHQIFERDSDIIQMIFRISDNKFQYVSPNIQSIMGYRSGEVGFSFFKSCFRKEHHKEWLKFFDVGAFNESGKKKMELEMSSKYGVVKWMEWQANLVKSNEGEVEFVLFALTDISQRKEQEKSNAQYLKELEQIISERKVENKEEAKLIELNKALDIKNPIRSVDNFIDLLEKRISDQEDDTSLEFLNKVHTGLEKVREMVDGVSNISQIDKKESLMKKIDLNAVLEKVKSNLSYRLYDSRATIKSSELPNVMADEFQMEQLFQNLIENALTYNDSFAPCILISFEEKEESYTLEFTDNGLGVAPKYQKGIFDMFTQVHPEVSHNGSGIGLAICKRICEKHQGKIWVESDGKGSRFYFTIPNQDLWWIDGQLEENENIKHLDHFFTTFKKSETI